MNGSYAAYRKARDLSWKILIKHRISCLPVKVSDICKAEGIGLYSYRRAEKLITCYRLERNCEDSDGFTFSRNGQRVILYDDATSTGRQRFTAAHELGHCLLGHIDTDGTTPSSTEPSESDNEMEMQANVFASRLLAPACVLHAAGVHSPEDIVRLCNISVIAAKYRWERLKKLSQRSDEWQREKNSPCFLQSELEQQVFGQFADFLAGINQSVSSEPSSNRRDNS